MQSTSADLREFLRNPPHETVRILLPKVPSVSKERTGRPVRWQKLTRGGCLSIWACQFFFPPEAIHPVKPKGGKQLTPEVVAREQDDPLCTAWLSTGSVDTRVSGVSSYTGRVQDKMCGNFTNLKILGINTASSSFCHSN